MLRAVIFDFDGTLADTISAICEGVNLTMRKHGYPEHTEEEVRSFINHGPRELMRRAVPSEWKDDTELIDRVLADFDRFYAEVCLHTDRCYDGLRELVEELHGMGMKIAVLSNKRDPYVKALCQHVLTPNTCDMAQGAIYGKPTKPDPYLTEVVLSTLGVAPAECAFVGDSDVDIKTANNAGLLHVGVTWGYRDEAFLRENGATLFAHTPEELKQLILEYKNKGESLC